MGGDPSLASLATWADTVAHGAHTETYGLHFVDIPLASPTYEVSATHPATIDAATRYDCVYEPKGGPPQWDTCVVKAIPKYAQILRSVSDPATNSESQRQAQREALAYLVHFVGDIHQPLHTVADNAGENGIRVQAVSQPKPSTSTVNTNLHAVWDTWMFAGDDYSWQAILDTISANYFDLKPGTSEVDYQSDRQHLLTDHCLIADVEQRAICWANEAHQIAQKPGLVQNNGAILGHDYLDQFRGDRDLQMLRAGRRLAQLLDEVFSP